jgi:hypothetical protein
MAWLLEKDALNGAEGKGFAKINGQQREMFGLKNFNTNAEFQESDFRVVGTRLIQKKTNGVQLTGTMTLYYGTTDFLSLAETYIKTGELPYFELSIENNDPTSTMGVRRVAFYNVKLQTIPISLLDADVEYLTEEIGFSFTSFEVLSRFKTPTALGS